jgi:hypothetical protein
MAPDGRIPLLLRGAGALASLSVIRGDTALIIVGIPELPDEALEPAWAAVRSMTWQDGPAHPPSCACCVGLAPQGEVLVRLFQDRARGQVAFFSRVVIVAPPEQLDAVAATVRLDPFARAYYQIEAVTAGYVST